MPAAAPITVAILVKDEADRLPNALDSLPPVAEVLVLDAGSRDGSAELAEARGCRVLRTDWPGFVAQRNRALAEASQPWVLFLDADETLEPELARGLGALPEGVEGFRLRRRNRWLGAEVQGGMLRPTWILRLVRRDGARCVGGAVHEELAVDGPVRDWSPGGLLHDPYRDLGHQLQKLATYADLAQAEGSLLDLLLRPAARFWGDLLLRGGWRDGGRGVLLAWISACYAALKWGRPWWRRP